MTREQWRFRLGVGAALVAGLLLRLWFVSHMPRIDGDSLIYGGIAKNWIEHGVYGFLESGPRGSVQIRPTLIRLPGYPLFLAGCFRLFGMEHYRAVVNLQVAADLITCCLAAALAGRLFGGRAQLPVLWLAALCPFTANYASMPLTETLTLLSIALALYGFARWQDAGCGYNHWLWIVAGALAWSLLLRPEQVLFAAAVLPAMLWLALASRSGRSVPRALAPVLVAALCAILPLVPWTLRNWRTFHVFQPLAPRYANDPGELAPLGFSRWYRTWAIDYASTEEVYWNYSGDRIELSDLPQRAFELGSPAQTADLRAHTARLLADYNATSTVAVSPSLDARFAALAAERVRAHPGLYYLGLPIARVLDMLLRPRVELMPIPLEWWRWKLHPAKTAFAAGYAVLNLAYLSVGFAGFRAWKRRGWLSPDGSGDGMRSFRALAFAMAACLLLRAALLLTIDNSEPRYTLEFFPVVFVWAGALFAAPLRSMPATHADPDPSN